MGRWRTRASNLFGLAALTIALSVPNSAVAYTDTEPATEGGGFPWGMTFLILMALVLAIGFGALMLRGERVLYGRYWGAIERVDGLHFEACYYQAIDFAIQHGLGTVEAGAQGEHKLMRGFMPVETVSAHWIADRRFRGAIASFLERERLDNAAPGTVMLVCAPAGCGIGAPSWLSAPGRGRCSGCRAAFRPRPWR